jgi:hypothetical protein
MVGMTKRMKLAKMKPGAGGSSGFDVIVEAGLAQSGDHSFNSALWAAVGGAKFLLEQGVELRFFYSYVLSCSYHNSVKEMGHMSESMKAYWVVFCSTCMKPIPVAEVFFN